MNNKENAPETGDSMNLSVWAGMVISSVAGLVFINRKNK
ncbi:MAG TPA: hypothetical protein DDY58_10250 [Terrisporobacter glycolicus]|nr:hypothetical protein [Terrisporobacter hibernicus]